MRVIEGQTIIAQGSKTGPEGLLIRRIITLQASGHYIQWHHINRVAQTYFVLFRFDLSEILALEEYQ